LNKYLILSFLILVGCADDVMSSETEIPRDPICGNLILEDGEQCDENSESCEECVIVDRKIFLHEYPQPIISLTGGECSHAAWINNLSRGIIWENWLSTEETDIRDIIFSPYVYKLLDGTIIANDSADLIDGNIQNPINLTEYGNIISNALVWTGTNEFGQFTGNDCLNWNFDVPELNGTVGNSSLTGSQWTNYRNESCNQEFRIYCVESDY
jgi:hypothetical protein